MFDHKRRRRPLALTKDEWSLFMNHLRKVSLREECIAELIYGSKLTLSQILDLKINSERVFQSRFKNRVPLSRIFYVFKQAAQAAGLSRPVGVLDIKATAKCDADEIRKSVL